MPLNFPLNPTIGDTYTSAGTIWTFSGTAWNVTSGGGGGLSSGNIISVNGGYVDNRVVRYDGTSGSNIQNSLVSIADDGAITAPNNTGSMIPFYYETFASLPSAVNSHGAVAHAHDTGKMYYAHAAQWFELANVADITAGGAASDSFTTIAVAGQPSITADSSTDTLTLVAGANVTITANSATDTLTISSSGGGGAASDSFTTIAVAGQNSVVADSSTDTLTLVAGTNITITTNSATDTITVNSTAGGSTTFAALTDIAGLTVDKIYLPAVTRLAVTANGTTAYLFDQYTGNNPTIYAVSGTTMAFDLSVGLGSHPFLIRTSLGVNYNIGLTHVTAGGVVTTGASAQGKTSGTLYWKIPATTTGNYQYICANHASMAGVVAIKDIAVI